MAIWTFSRHKLVQHLRRILQVDFCKISAAVCMQVFQPKPLHNYDGEVHSKANKLNMQKHHNMIYIILRA